LKYSQGVILEKMILSGSKMILDEKDLLKFEIVTFE
jgi:hypothetical protein